MAEKDQGVKLEKHVTGVATFSCGKKVYAVEIRPTRAVVITSVQPEILAVPDLGLFITRLQDIKRKIDDEMPAPRKEPPVRPDSGD